MYKSRVKGRTDVILGHPLLDIMLLCWCGQSHRNSSIPLARGYPSSSAVNSKTVLVLFFPPSGPPPLPRQKRASCLILRKSPRWPGLSDLFFFGDTNLLQEAPGWFCPKHPLRDQEVVDLLPSEHLSGVRVTAVKPVGFLGLVLQGSQNEQPCRRFFTKQHVGLQKDTHPKGIQESNTRKWFGFCFKNRTYSESLFM